MWNSERGKIIMSQRLILPINQCRVTASYKHPNYHREFGYRHYGCDFTDLNKKDKTIWASGNGTVVETGWSDSCGNVVIVVYPSCELANGKVMDLTVRYYHLEKILAKKGQKVCKDSRLGLYGSTGASTGDHLHFEVDTDCDYYIYTPQIGKNSGVLRSGVDTTLNPLDCIWIKPTKPDYQSFHLSGYDTVENRKPKSL